MNLSIIPCGEERIENLVQFLTRLNEDPLHHIGYFGVGEKEIRASLEESTIPVADNFQLAYENGKLVGIFGVDINPEIGRAWLLGPVVDHPHWQGISGLLFSIIHADIPIEMKEWELFGDVKNVNLQEFAIKHGFTPNLDTALLYLKRDMPASAQPTKGIKITDFDEKLFEQFEILHNDIFPKTYYTAKQIIEKRGDLRRLMTVVEKGQLLGYSFCKIEAELGYIDFIGVARPAQRKGLGVSLLETSVDWMFSNPEVQMVRLTVNTNNNAALSLYEKFGFQIERVMRGYRKMVNV